MGQCTINSREAQEERAKIKTLNHQMEKTAVEGTGLSPWEAKVLVDCIEDIYFSEQNIRLFWVFYGNGRKNLIL